MLLFIKKILSLPEEKHYIKLDHLKIAVFIMRSSIMIIIYHKKKKKSKSCQIIHNNCFSLKINK